MPQEPNNETLVVQVGWARFILLWALLLWTALVFLFMGAVAFAIDVTNPAGLFVLFLVGVVLIALAIYFLLMLLTSFNRVEVGPERLVLRMARTRGPLPLPSFIRTSLPYDSVASVEMREEMYKTFGLVTLLRVFSVVTRDGTRLPLGVMAENWGAQMPIDKAAALVAVRANTQIVDKGAIRVGGILRGTIAGSPDWTAEAMAPDEVAKAHRRAGQTLQFIGLIGVSVALLRACAPN